MVVSPYWSLFKCFLTLTYIILADSQVSNFSLALSWEWPTRPLSTFRFSKLDWVRPQSSFLAYHRKYISSSQKSSLQEKFPLDRKWDVGFLVEMGEWREGGTHSPSAASVNVILHKYHLWIAFLLQFLMWITYLTGSWSYFESIK